MKTWKYLVAAGLAMAMGGSMAWAQAAGPAGGGPRGQQGREMEMMVEAVVMALNTLELTADQSKKIDALHTAFNEKAQPLGDRLEEKTRALANRRQNDPEDAAGIQQMQKEIEDTTLTLHRAGGDFVDKAKAVLTKDQLKQFGETPQGRMVGMLSVQIALRDLLESILPFKVHAMMSVQMTADQHTKMVELMKQYQASMEKIKKEYEAKFQELLTDEQKKAYEKAAKNE